MEGELGGMLTGVVSEHMEHRPRLGPPGGKVVRLTHPRDLGRTISLFDQLAVDRRDVLEIVVAYGSARRPVEGGVAREDLMIVLGRDDLRQHQR